MRRKAAWIVQRLRHVQSHDLPSSPREFVSGETVLYLGRHYRLKVHSNETGEAKLRGGWLHVPAPAGARRTAHVRAALVSWLRGHAAVRLPERVEAWRSKAGVEMPRIVIADQQKRWGSCDRNGTIRFNWRIIQAPMRLVDYVVVHELVHLRHRGHGPRLLAGSRQGHAGLRAAPGGPAAAGCRTGVVRFASPRIGCTATSSDNGALRPAAGVASDRRILG